MTTAVQANLIAIALKRDDFPLATKLALLAHVGQNGAGNRGVFLDNAYGEVSDKVSPVEWRQALSVLARQGFYEASQDPEYKGRFGYVAKNAE